MEPAVYSQLFLFRFSRVVEIGICLSFSNCCRYYLYIHFKCNFCNAPSNLRTADSSLMIIIIVICTTVLSVCIDDKQTCKEGWSFMHITGHNTKNRSLPKQRSLHGRIAGGEIWIGTAYIFQWLFPGFGTLCQGLPS